MNVKLIVWIFVCFASSVLVIVFLSIVSNDMTKRPGSFLRQFPPHPALEGDVLDFKYNSYYLAGYTPTHAYLANYTAPLNIIVYNTQTADTQHIRLRVKGIMDQKFWAVRVKVDSPYFYVADGAVPAIFRGKVDTWEADRYPFDHAFFLDMTPLSPESFAIKALGNPVRETTLGKITTQFPHTQMKQGILQKQIDGIFCTDGMMHYDKARKQLLYLHYYRNQYILMDTNLTVTSKRTTIDTITTAKINVTTIAASSSKTLSSPPRLVNKGSCISGNVLFVNSNSVAKNQSSKSLDDASIIDVYALSTGEYKFSFYIYDFQGREKLRQFGTAGNKMFALFDTHLQVWDLLPKYFDN